MSLLLDSLADWMVIDMETAAEADEVLLSNFRLLGWNDETLDERSRYTKHYDQSDWL